MKTKKLGRRLKILRWIRKQMGLNGLVQMSIFLQSSKKITFEAIKIGHSDAMMEAQLTDALAEELVKFDLVRLDKGTEGDDYIKGMETWIASLKIII
ncbi:hypothetical protein LCGC14_0989650 [marine sediment metagenome]|uniref:Uncharacterized protein n=1 Tax=marine sediment metagenome TaxID=412755 RepID=A0A0F9N634_9ZZZZ